MSLAAVMAETSTAHFFLWIEYLKTDANRFKPENYYLAQIAAEIRRTIAKDPKSVSTNDFILNFTEKKDTKTVESNEDIKEERTKKSKGKWLSMLGIKKKDR